MANYRAMSLTARGLAMKNVKMRLQDEFKGSCRSTDATRNTHAIGYDGCFNIAPLSIGTDMLKKLRIYVASAEGVIYFTPAEPGPATAGDAPAAAPPANQELRVIRSPRKGR